ncbi:hypothetical protein CB0940_09319 [Cercospora beticola]|uniref:Uncharacterized protein n=1 Tax=Cercospora beticola TaxID=122368 RepID=A0A2G5HFX9_CERBT|nr:hypothetical protein CB0940_09319 [Cercospora beticola]PIA91454.1 hypothetical protein CB0940_09319 [Cercospora beticola]
MCRQTTQTTSNMTPLLRRFPREAARCSPITNVATSRMRRTHRR